MNTFNLMPTKTKSDNPKQVKLTAEEAEVLRERVLNLSELSKGEKDLLAGLISFNLWLQQQLSKANFRIRQLKKLFGFSTEKKKSTADDVALAQDSSLHETESSSADETNNLSNAANDTDANASNASNPNTDDNKLKKKKKPKWNDKANHGRLGFDDYPGLETVTITADKHCPGDACPDCQEAGQTGKLYAYDAGCFIRLEGQPLVSGKRYKLAGVRCHLCSTVFKPDVPASIKEAPKFSPSAVSSIAMGHYSNGLPFYRIENWQYNCGVPLPDATQYDEMAKLAKKVLPIVQCLRQLSANSSLFYYDDTPFQILQGGKKTAHGTAIVSQTGSHWIYLFCVNDRIAGKEVSKLLKKRSCDENFISMTDASNQNELSELDETLLPRIIIAYCLVHGRRKFYELLGDHPKECQFIISCIADVYRHEAHCQREKLSPYQRLKYHQQHSDPVMDSLKTYLNNLWLYEAVEHNSPLGKAVKYMLTRWPFLTRFLTVEGCPIDNTLCERAIKSLIRYRKNSLFYRTQAGAKCGNTLMSLIQTAIKNNVNAFDYLNTLQENEAAVESNPEGFLPWNYQATLAQMHQANAA